EYDLLIIDHPWAGFAQKSDILVNLADKLPKDFLDDQLNNSVGKSYISYNFNGFQSALAIDAATPIAIYNKNYFTKKTSIPKNWEEVIDLAKKGKVAIAGIPINLLMDFYMFSGTLDG